MGLPLREGREGQGRAEKRGKRKDGKGRGKKREKGEGKGDPGPLSNHLKHCLNLTNFTVTAY